jgi:hypothetical protein
MDNNYIKKYFDEMAYYIPDSEYFKDVVINNDTSIYYSDFIDNKKKGGKGNSTQMIKSTPYGKMYVNDDESAFVQIVFYPVLIVTIISIVAILTRFF